MTLISCSARGCASRHPCGVQHSRNALLCGDGAFCGWQLLYTPCFFSFLGPAWYHTFCGRKGVATLQPQHITLPVFTGLIPCQPATAALHGLTTGARVLKGACDRQVHVCRSAFPWLPDHEVLRCVAVCLCRMRCRAWESSWCCSRGRGSGSLWTTVEIS